MGNCGCSAWYGCFARYVGGTSWRGLRPGMALLLGLVLISSDRGAEASPKDTGLFGSYLAGRFAQRIDDWTAAAGFMNQALGHDRTNPLLLRRAFIAAVGSGNVDAALPLARTLAIAKQTTTFSDALLVADAVANGRLMEASTIADRLPRETAASQILKPLILAWVRAGLGNTTEAIAALDDLRKIDGVAPLARLHEALISEFSGRTEAAANAYTALLGASASWRAIHAAARFYKRQGRAAEANALVADFINRNGSEAILENPSNGLSINRPIDGLAEAFFDVAVAFDQDGVEETAMLAGRIAGWIRPDFALVQLLLGDVMLRRGHTLDGLALYERAAKDQGLAWLARLKVTDALNLAGRREEAKAQLVRMTAERPERADAPTRLGDLYRQTERFDVAAEAYGLAIDRSLATQLPAGTGRLWTLYYARGIALERGGRWPQAEADLLRALELAPNQPAVMNYLGYSWVDQGMNLERGLGMLEQAVALQPNDGHIVDSLGWANLKLGRLSVAIGYLEKAVGSKPMDPVINDHLGDAYWAVGRFAEARFQWERSLIQADDKALISQINEKLARQLPRRVIAGTARPPVQP